MEQINWLLVGTGDIASKRVASALIHARGSRLAAVCDRVGERAQALAAKYGVDQIFTDLDEALNKSGANAVYVATPVDLHIPQAIAALEAGKHVLVEKPLGLDAPQCGLAIAKAEEAGLAAGCSYFRRCYPCFGYTQELLTRRELGEVIHVRMTYHSWAKLVSEDPKYWRVLKNKSGGGPLSDMASHMIDVMIGLLGVPRVVYGKTATLTHGYEVEDSAALLMELENRAQVMASFHWNSKTWSHEFEIVGTEGRVKWSPYDSGKLWKTAGRDTVEVNLPNAENVHLPLVEDFVEAIRECHQPVAPFMEAAKTNLVLDAIYESSRTGKEIRFGDH
jgi:predicted dehydrogenase